MLQAQLSSSQLLSSPACGISLGHGSLRHYSTWKPCAAPLSPSGSEGTREIVPWQLPGAPFPPGDARGSGNVASLSSGWPPAPSVSLSLFLLLQLGNESCLELEPSYWSPESKAGTRKVKWDHRPLKAVRTPRCPSLLPVCWFRNPWCRLAWLLSTALLPHWAAVSSWAAISVC